MPRHLISGAQANGRKNITGTKSHISEEHAFTSISNAKIILAFTLEEKGVIIIYRREVREVNEPNATRIHSDCTKCRSSVHGE